MAMIDYLSKVEMDLLGMHQQAYHAHLLEEAWHGNEAEDVPKFVFYEELLPLMHLHHSYLDTFDYNMEVLEAYRIAFVAADKAACVENFLGIHDLRADERNRETLTQKMNESVQWFNGEPKMDPELSRQSTIAQTYKAAQKGQTLEEFQEEQRAAIEAAVRNFKP